MEVTMPKINGQYCAVIWHGYDVSGKSRQFEFNDEHTEEEATAFQDGAINSQGGLSNIDGNVQSFMDSPLDLGAFEAYKSPGGSTDKVLMILFGVEAVPDEGDFGVAALMKQFQVVSGMVPTEKVPFDANFLSSGYKADHGQVLDYATITDTKDCDEVDFGAISTVGITSYLSVFKGTAEDTPGTDTYVIKVQHSVAGGGSWIDYETFVSDGSARTSERIENALTCQRYRKAQLTRTGAAGDDLGFAILVADN